MMDDAKMNGESEGGKEEKIKCSKCSYLALDKRLLQRHMKQKHSPSKHTCEQCGEKFSRALMYKLHLATHNTTNEHACSTCGKTFPLVSLLKIHQETHSTESIHPCPHCSKQFRQKSALSKHVAFGHNKKNIHACTTCGQVFPSPSTLILHMDTHKNEKATPKSKVNLTKQEEVDKAPINLRTSSPYRRHIEHNMFKCQRCQKKFFTSSALARHMRIHANVQTHVCPECKIEFTSKKALQKHSSAHIFECDRCGRKYRQRTQLEYHLQNDCKGNLLICKICGRVFGKSSGLRRHMEIHQETGNKFQCPECCKNYKTQADLQTHQWLHQGDGFKCDDCGKAFGTKQHLIWHSYLHMSRFPAVSGSDSEVKKETDNSESNAEREDITELETVLKPPPTTPSKIKKEKADTPDPSGSKEQKKESKSKSSTHKTPKKDGSSSSASKSLKKEAITPVKKGLSKNQKSLKNKTPTRTGNSKKSSSEVKKDKKSQPEKAAAAEKSGEGPSGSKSKPSTPNAKTSKAILKKKAKGKKSLKPSHKPAQNDVAPKESIPAPSTGGEAEETSQTIKEVEELIAQGVDASVKRESIDVKDIPSAEVMFDDIDENVELDIREAIATLTEMGSHNEIEAQDLIESIAGVNQGEDVTTDAADADADAALTAAAAGTDETLDVVEQALQTDPMVKDDLEALYAMDTDNDTENERETTELHDEESAQLLSELTGIGDSQLESCSEMQTQTEMETQTDLDTLTENMNSTDIADELVSHINMEVVDAINQSTKEIENLCRAGPSEEAAEELVNEIVPTEEVEMEQTDSAKDNNDAIEENGNISQVMEEESLPAATTDQEEKSNLNLESSEKPAAEAEMKDVSDVAKDSEQPAAEESSAPGENTENISGESSKTTVEENENKMPSDKEMVHDDDAKPAEEKDSELSAPTQEPPALTEDESLQEEQCPEATNDTSNVTDGQSLEQDQVQHECEKCSADFGIGIKRTNCPHNKELKVVIEKLDCKDCPVKESSALPAKADEGLAGGRTKRSASTEGSVTHTDSAKPLVAVGEDLPGESPAAPVARSTAGASRLRRRVRQTSGTRSVSTKSCDTRRRESQSSNSDQGSKAADLSGMTTRSANQRVTRYTRSGIPLSDLRESRRTTPGSDRKHARKLTPPLARKKVETEKSPPPRYKVSTVTDLTIRITTQDATGNSQPIRKSLSPREDTSATANKAAQKPTYTVSTSPSQDPNQLSKLYISKSPPQRGGATDGRSSATIGRSPSDEALRRSAGATQELCVVMDDINELILLQQERLRKLKHLKPVRLSKDMESVSGISRKRKSRSEESLHLSDAEPRPAKVFLKLPRERVRKHEQRLAYIDKQFQDMSDFEKMAQIAKDKKRVMNFSGFEDLHEYQQPDSSQDMHKNKNVIKIPKVSTRKGLELSTLGSRVIGKVTTVPSTQSAAKMYAANEKPSLASDSHKKAYKQVDGVSSHAARSVLSVEECDSTSMAESIRHASSLRGGQSTSVSKRESKFNTERPAEGSSSDDDQSSDDVLYEPLDLSIRINQFAPTEVKPDPDGEKEDREESTDVDTHEEFCACSDKPSNQRGENSSQSSSSLFPVSVKVEPEASSGSSHPTNRSSSHNSDEYCSTDAQAGYVKGDVAAGVQVDTADTQQQYVETGDTANGDDGAGAAAEFIEVIDRATQCELGDEVLFCPETNQRCLGV